MENTLKKFENQNAQHDVAYPNTQNSASTPFLAADCGHWTRLQFVLFRGQGREGGDARALFRGGRRRGKCSQQLVPLLQQESSYRPGFHRRKLQLQSRQTQGALNLYS